MKPDNVQEEKEKILKGLRIAYKKMLEFKKQKGSELVISHKGKVLKIKPKDFHLLKDLK